MSNRNLDWRSYVDEKGNFEMPFYLYRIQNELMKTCLDFGTLLSDDSVKLRAYKEQVKKAFKKRWLEIAEAMEFFDLVVECGCRHNEFCEKCGGSRYRLNRAVSPDEMREIGVFYGAEADSDLAEKLQKGLLQAIRDVQSLPVVP